MKISQNGFLCLTALLGLCAPAFATVTITSLTSSPKSPQKIGKTITWTAKATDSNVGPLTFQFNVGPPGGALALVKDFNVGTLKTGAWTSQPFVWVPTGIAGSYQVQVVIKDFTTGETTSKTVKFSVSALVTGATPVVVKTANPLVALFGAPACAKGSTMRISFQEASLAKPAVTTNYVNCNASAALTFEIAGMYPSTAYNMFSQTNKGGVITDGPTVTFTTGALPANITFPTFTVKVAAGAGTDPTDTMLLLGPIQFGAGPVNPAVATDLSGNVMWYYYQSVAPNYTLLTRPLVNGSMLVVQDGPAWNPATQQQQLVRQIDLAGNIIKETNTGVLQQQLLKLGVTDAGPCSAIMKPAPVGSACLGGFHHEVMQTLPNGDTALFADIEKIFPPGTQGDTSGLPVDIVGDIIIVLNSSWQVVWSYDSFLHNDVTRAAVLGETCAVNQQGCPPMLLLGTGIAPAAKDWLHANSIYYWKTDGAGGASGDIVWSSKNQDWVFKIDYNNGAGTGNIIWRMGPGGDFTFNNINNDPYPWFSHQHEADVETTTGYLTLFDNGDTRVSPPPVGVGSGNSRGMALSINETTMQVTPVLSVDLGVYSSANGSAQLLPNGDYYFLPGVVLMGLSSEDSFAIEIAPTAGTTNGTQVLNIQGPSSYRGWAMPNLYNPPPS